MWGGDIYPNPQTQPCSVKSLLFCPLGCPGKMLRPLGKLVVGLLTEFHISYVAAPNFSFLLVAGDPKLGDRCGVDLGTSFVAPWDV